MFMRNIRSGKGEVKERKGIHCPWWWFRCRFQRYRNDDSFYSIPSHPNPTRPPYHRQAISLSTLLFPFLSVPSLMDPYQWVPMNPRTSRTQVFHFFLWEIWRWSTISCNERVFAKEQKNSPPHHITTQLPPLLPPPPLPCSRRSSSWILRNFAWAGWSFHFGKKKLLKNNNARTKKRKERNSLILSRSDKPIFGISYSCRFRLSLGLRFPSDELRNYLSASERWWCVSSGLDARWDGAGQYVVDACGDGDRVGVGDRGGGRAVEEGRDESC